MFFSFMQIFFRVFLAFRWFLVHLRSEKTQTSRIFFLAKSYLVSYPSLFLTGDTSRKLPNRWEIYSHRVSCPRYGDGVSIFSWGRWSSLWWDFHIWGMLICSPKMSNTLSDRDARYSTFFGCPKKTIQTLPRTLDPYSRSHENRRNTSFRNAWEMTIQYPPGRKTMSHHGVGFSY